MANYYRRSGFGFVNPDFEADGGEAGGDEEFEALDEDVEASSDESDEAFYSRTPSGAFSFEAMDEGDEGADEGIDEAVDEGVDEGIDEAVDEGSDEGIGGYYSASRRAAPPQHRFGGEAEAMSSREYQWRAARRREAAAAAQRQAASITQKVASQIDQQLRKVAEPATARLDKVGMIRGDGVFRATLPNGRTTSLRLDPAPATQRDVNLLTRRISTNDARQAKALRDQSNAIRQLKAAQASANKLHREEILKISKDLNKRILDGDSSLDKRISSVVETQKKLSSRKDMQFLRTMRLRQTQSTWNTVLLATALPIYAAYGQRALGQDGSFFTKDNAVLTGSLVGALYLDEFVARYFARDSKSWRSLVKFWSYAAPFIYAGGMYWYFNDKQNDRFITGVATSKNAGDATITVDLSKVFIGNKSASDDFGSYKSSSPQPVFATLQSADATVGGVEASVDSNGQLILTLLPSTVGTAIANRSTVFWAVDALGVRSKA